MEQAQQLPFLAAPLDSSALCPSISAFLVCVLWA